ncbi:MAG TPA: hypothetical protein VNU26_06810 [Mycobacteriales bacterium]|nr:hypothetical protein [Mycobacteriales bacterium]
MTETTNPLPDDPAGPTAMPEESTLVDGSDQLLDGGTTGTEDGPAGIPANLAGVDKKGDDVPTATGAPANEQTGVASEGDALSPSDSSAPQTRSASAGETAASSDLPAGREGR